MAYTPTTWANGDSVNAVKLNKLEQGVKDQSGLVVTVYRPATDVLILDKTWQEIFDAFSSGCTVILAYSSAESSDAITCATLVLYVGTDNAANPYVVYSAFGTGFVAADVNAYPRWVS